MHDPVEIAGSTAIAGEDRCSGRFGSRTRHEPLTSRPAFRSRIGFSRLSRTSNRRSLGHPADRGRNAELLQFQHSLSETSALPASRAAVHRERLAILVTTHSVPEDRIYRLQIAHNTSKIVNSCGAVHDFQSSPHCFTELNRLDSETGRRSLPCLGAHQARTSAFPAIVLQLGTKQDHDFRWTAFFTASTMASAVSPYLSSSPWGSPLSAKASPTSTDSIGTGCVSQTA